MRETVILSSITELYLTLINELIIITFSIGYSWYLITMYINYTLMHALLCNTLILLFTSKFLAFQLSVF